MMKNVRTQARYWLAGIALAAVGVALARGCAPVAGRFGPSAVAVTGRALAGAGLFILALGVSRRAHSRTGMR